ncbi:hypothetical protein ASPZODRAFT_166328 [Penicilliopsis zonata CBS 506.65]|uniref:RING-CH-type domain-containing protein n=1 Tax=Penicilliopsis zonata CBS 506.65 TaxID=1073090 RepID=A0A1L9SIN5_9EURO|nr:hypothetical protein ASPZODRAFT_166328 [Penicilliopsis zonata CBS 506.65]OJJ47079.1 hypothetical protein ASPZODRAFT_166328 [Penicilliopsis zonata CBS 506.65]
MSEPDTDEVSHVVEDMHQSGTQATPDETSEKRYYPPRTCRICLEVVLPTYEPPSENLPGFLQHNPRVIYMSSDPDLGRLLRPCKCKGSSRYVHEGCLRYWRHADSDYRSRNYWHCPTCGFQYRLERLRWARWISSIWTQFGLTFLVLISTVFLLGFVADPIIHLYFTHMESFYDLDFWEPDLEFDVVATGSFNRWLLHFTKGLASLGVLSFIKALFALSSWHWWGLRSTGLVSSGRNTGRSRVSSVTWLVILIGVGAFLVTVYKALRAWSRRTLEKVGEHVMDVPLPDDDEEDAETLKLYILLLSFHIVQVVEAVSKLVLENEYCK